MTWSPGPAGLVLGPGVRGPVATRLFRPKGTRVALQAPDYVGWLLVHRSAALGAHISVGDPGPWQTLLDRIARAGASVDIGGTVPDCGLPYRPSLVLGDATGHIGPWQAHIVTVAADDALARYRAADLAIATPDEAGAEHLRRAFHLTGGQARAAQALSENQVALVSAHRLVRVTVRPGHQEYRALFG